jgi:hypothetical protein
MIVGRWVVQQSVGVTASGGGQQACKRIVASAYR